MRETESKNRANGTKRKKKENVNLSLLIKLCSYLVQSSLDSPRDKSARSSPLVHHCCCLHRTRVDRYSELTFSTLEWITKRTRRTKRSRPPRFDDSKYQQRTRLPISRIRFCGSSLTSRTRAEAALLLLLLLLDWWFWSPCVVRVSLSLFSLSLSLSLSLFIVVGVVILTKIYVPFVSKSPTFFIRLGCVKP